MGEGGRPRIADANTEVENHRRFGFNYIRFDILPCAMAGRLPGELPDYLPHHRLFLVLSSSMGEGLA